MVDLVERIEVQKTLSASQDADGIGGTDITPLQYGVLAFLNAHDGEPGIDQISLAGRMGLERSHVSLLIEELAKKGLVDQRVNDTDRRARDGLRAAPGARRGTVSAWHRRGVAGLRARAPDGGEGEREEPETVHGANCTPARA